MDAPSWTNYKYRSGAAALRCLSEGTAYFASPGELNDSLEAKFELMDAAHYIDAVESAIRELALRRGHLRGYSFNKAAFAEFELAHTRENQRFQDACQQVGIFSAACRPNDQAMWAYYCDNLQGVCLELEWSTYVLQKYQLLPNKVCYTRKARVLNRADDLHHSLLELGSQNPDWSMAQLQEFALTEEFRRLWGIRSVARAVSLKHADWRHERELRIIAARSEPVPMIEEILKRVFFIRTDFPEWSSIMMLLHKLYPKVELARLNFEHKEPFVKIEPFETKLIPI